MASASHVQDASLLGKQEDSQSLWPCALASALVAGVVREPDRMPSRASGPSRPSGPSGALPLHLALEYGASEEVCLRLCEEHPESVHIADGRGRLPLALALEFGAPRAVAWALMVAHPEGARAMSSGGVQAAMAGIRMKSEEEQRVDALKAKGAWH